MISFMISVVPPKIDWTRLSATRACVTEASRSSPSTPGQSIVPAPGGLQQVCVDLPQGTVPVQVSFRQVWLLHLLETELQGNPAFAISRGSPGAPLRTPGHDRRFPACYFTFPFPLSPLPFPLSDLGSATRSRDISSSPCPLRERYSAASRGAATTLAGRAGRCSRIHPPDGCIRLGK
jgi:hypothetical protein